MSWLQLRFHTTPDKQETLEDALMEAGAASITFLDGADQPILEPGLNETPLWDDLVIMALFEAGIDVKAKLGEIQSLFIEPLPEHRVEILEDKDWVREWMDSYQPLKFGSDLWICPSWLEPPDPKATNIMLDPGLAFGTGTHPTTAMCLEMIDEMDFSDKDIMDYGCGSGILAIAALLKGAKAATGTDIDPQAINASRENVSRNDIALEKTSFFIAGQEPAIPADVVFANILAGPLVELAPKLQSLLKPEGTLILSGLLVEQMEAVKAAYTEINFTDQRVTDEWLCLKGIKFN